MRRTGLLFIVCSFIACINSMAQVNLQTGSATFALPIFSWQDNKSRLNANIALSYHSGNGLKVSDISSNVGQGWNLIAGGSIVRMQVGEPDDQVARIGNEWDIHKYPPGILYASTSAANGCPEGIARYPIYGWRNQLYVQRNDVAEDKQLDYFSFQFNGKTGMFVLDPTDIGKARSLGDTKMIFTFQQDASLINQGIRTKITSFTIKDVDGLIYKFTRHGLTKILKTEYCDVNQVKANKQPKLSSGKVYYQAAFDGEIADPYVIGSWHLTEIEDGLTHRKVFLNYVTRNINSVAGEDIVYSHDKNYSMISHKKSITQTPVLSSVTYPDGHTATFNFGAARVDLNGDFALSSIDLTYQGRYLSRHELNTTYFILNRYGTPITNYQKSVARLCLKSIRKIGVDLKEDTPPYIFDYYLGSNSVDDFIPPPFFYAKDIWGFYNGNNSQGFNPGETIPLNTTITTLNNSQLRGLCFLRHGLVGAITLNPKTGYAKNGLLKQIIYPTGGTLTYDYGQNVGILGGVNREVGGVAVKKTISTDGGFSNDCANPISTDYHYVMNGPGSASSLWGLEMPVNSTTTSNHYQPESKRYKVPVFGGCGIFGCCEWRYKYPGIQSMQQSVDLTGFQKIMSNLSPYLNILSVLSTIHDIVMLCLGPTPLVIVGVVMEVIVSIATVLITCIGDQSRDVSYTNYYNADLNGVSPLPAQFKRVEVIESPGGIGKTIQEFTSDLDYAIWEPTNPAYSAKQRFAPWAYGLPKSTVVYDASGNKIKETIQAYDYDSDWGGPCGGMGEPPCYIIAKAGLQTISCKCLVVKSSSQRNTNWYNHTPTYITSSNASIKVDIYDMYTGRTMLDSTIEKVYQAGDPNKFVQTITRYTYNKDYLPALIKTNTSNMDVNWKKIRYAGDFNDNGVLLALRNARLDGTPVAISNYFFRHGSNYYTSEQVTEFAVLANGDIKPYRLLEQRFDQPKTTAQFQEYVQPGHGSNPPYKETQTFTYNTTGDLIGIKDEGNRQITSIYDYNDKYVSASVINADPSVDKAAYTSFETLSTAGNWTVNGPFNTNPNFITGSKSLTFTTSNTITRTLNTARPHTLSFWASNTSFSVSSGSTQVKNAPTISGFTYYEYDIAQGTASVILTGTGTVNLDELRVYPKTSRMRSVTYDPLLGKTSECDENNRITYYEYDRLGRLQFIKDEKRNVVKMYEYNNVSESKQKGCPGIYYNNLISEVFIKNNCAPGYVGSSVNYSVPANTYSSVISQQAADAQAENNILVNGQNYANTNGTCIPIYYNTQQSQVFVTENCPPGYVGGNVTYTVPANRYNSTVSQAAANQMALDEIDANGQANANNPPNQVCTTSSAPVWEWLEGAPWYCLSVNGALPPHLFILETDINPNSPTYNQTRWTDAGQTELCDANTYFNAIQSQSFTRNNCPPGYTGSSVTYSVQPGTYSSTTSQAAANQLALNDIAANGQAYANANGTCTQGCGTCTGDDKKCINNVCETGYLAVTGAEYGPWRIGGIWYSYRCTNRYCFSDGSLSTYFTYTYSNTFCAITCY